MGQEKDDQTKQDGQQDSSSGNGNPETSLRWYVLHAYAGCEAQVIRMLRERIRVEGLEHRFGEIAFPTEEVVEMRGGVKRKSTRKFFPGYLLIQMEMDDRTWHLVRSSPKVLGFIGGKVDKPAPITDDEASQILQRAEVGNSKPRHKVMFEVGEVLRIINGPFSDFDGVVEDVNYEKMRLRVSVVIFGRATPVELEFSQVEKTK